jgi:protein-S-isoprenylcysteine O-methyltransferase Ste14
MSKRTKWLRPAVWAFYSVLVLEFLFMISPLALHFYAGYGPVLNALHASSWTSWSTGFFLPHFSTTTNIVLNNLKTIGFPLVLIGLLLFVLGAAQIYGAKLLRRGLVTGGLYRLSRHPQYTGLAIVGLGTVLIWPRFLVLASYVTMLFLYSLLARWEEQRCLSDFGDSYRSYMRRTGRIVPGLGVGERAADGAPGHAARHLAGAYLISLAVLLALAFGLRSWSLSTVSAVFEPDAAILSPAELSDDELRSAYRLALASQELQARLALRDHPKLLVYVVPIDWFLPDLPLHSEEEIRRVGGGHRTPEFEPGRYKVLITSARLHALDAAGADIVKRAYGRDPLLIVRVDTRSNEILGSTEPPPHVIWGDIPTPMV